MSTLVKRARGKDLHTVVSGVFDAVQENAVSEIPRLVRAQPAKIVPCLHLLRGDGLVPKFGLLSEGEKAFPLTYVNMPQNALRAKHQMASHCTPTAHFPGDGFGAVQEQGAQAPSCSYE